MRKFKLQNNVGAEWDLMDKTSYLNAPGGLGFGKPTPPYKPEAHGWYRMISLTSMPLQAK